MADPKDTKRFLGRVGWHVGMQESRPETFDSRRHVIEHWIAERRWAEALS